MPHKLITIFGQLENGKTTFAKMLQQHLNRAPGVASPLWERKSFARPGKQFVADVMGVSLDFLDTWKANPEPPPGWKKPVRQVLQEAISYWRTVKPAIWTEKALSAAYIIVDDARFEDELIESKKRNGYTILIYRPDKYNTDTHESEAFCRKLLNPHVSDFCVPLDTRVNCLVNNTWGLDELNQMAFNVATTIMRLNSGT